MKHVEVCDVCGKEVSPSEAVRAEVAFGDMMCPTPMTFHGACYERASDLMQPGQESFCTTDPLFPETQQWTSPESTGSEKTQP